MPEPQQEPLAGAAKQLEGLGQTIPIPSAQPLPTVDTKALAAHADSVVGSSWFWLVLLLLVGVAVTFGIWWWRRKSAAALPKLTPDTETSKPEPYREFQLFRAGLPRDMARALDDFQPLFVLGSNASDKERLVREFSGVTGNEQRFPKRVSLQGKCLATHLGATSLVLLPTDEFLRTPAADENPSWGKLVRRICRTRRPGVLVCLSQSPIDSGAIEEIAAWASTLRRHIDFIAATRNEPVDVSIVLAQSSATRGQGALGLTDALFHLLSAADSSDACQEAQSISLDGLEQLLPSDSEARREVASRWIAQRLRSCRSAWPTLLARSGSSIPEVLQHVVFFEQFERLTTSLGASVAELLAGDSVGQQRVRGIELCFLPNTQDALGRAVRLFATSTTVATQWRPSRTVWHRLVATTLAAVSIGTMWCCYAESRGEWDAAARIANDYLPPDGKGLAEVQEYALKVAELANTRSSQNSAGLIRVGRRLKSLAHSVYLSFAFFDRDLPRCVVLTKTREYLEERLRTATSRKYAPERVLQLGALYLAGDPWDCNETPARMIEPHRQLMRTIEDHSEQWQPLTGLSKGDIKSYLALACPVKNVPKPVRETLQRYDWGEQDRRHWQVVPDAARLAKALQVLRGNCALDQDEKNAIEQVWASFRDLDGAVIECSAANEVFRRMQALEMPTPDLPPNKASEQSERLRALEELGSERADLDLLLKDIRAFALADVTRAAVLGKSIDALNALLEREGGSELPSANMPMVELTLGRDTYLIDRRKVRRSLLLHNLNRLVQAASERDWQLGTQESALFSPEQAKQEHVWLTASAIPQGIVVTNVVPWRYSVEGFNAGVSKPIARTSSLSARLVCQDETTQGESGSFTEGLWRFTNDHIVAYLSEYERAWRRVYDGFGLDSHTESTFTNALVSLTAPMSPQLAMMREVLKQTSLSVDAKLPWASAVSSLASAFQGLTAALDEKAFAEYQGLLVEMVNLAQEKKDATAPANAAAVANGKPEDVVDAFIQDLSGYARVVANGARDPKQDIRTRVYAWVDRAKVPLTLRRPFLEPVDLAYGFGRQSLRDRFSNFWKEYATLLKAEIIDVFPFKQTSSKDASVTSVISWLEPSKGRLFVELAPVYDWMRSIRAWGSEPPSDVRDTIVRLRSISRVLFKENGEPTTIRIKCEPVPFEGSVVTGSTLSVGDRVERYFNTQPHTMELLVPWSADYVASIRIDTSEGDADGNKPSPMATPSSPWAFFHLLRLGSTRTTDVAKASGSRALQTGDYAWEFNASSKSLDRRKVLIRYRICQDPRQCEGLFSREMFQWN